ncbi:MAG: GNAT family N-acetyltransferase [Pseudomonadota bacterium]
MEAHRDHVPTALVERRTLERFKVRLKTFGDSLRVCGPVGAPIGFCVIGDAEVDQLFVAPAGRGAGVARALLSDAEERLHAQGFLRAHLLCIIENTRAARFYEACGWVSAGISHEAIQTEDGPISFDVLRFEKSLR